MESAYQRPTVKQPASHTENDKAMNQSMRTILPVWKTTPIAALHRESRFGPAEVFDAEAAGALDGLKAALTLQDSATQDIIICLDNLAAATRLRGAPSDSSQDAFLEFQALAASHGSTQVRWAPGHTDIPGNEQADKLAKAASSAPEPEGAQPTLAYLRRIARQKPKEAFETWWSTSAPEQYKGLNLIACLVTGLSCGYCSSATPGHPAEG
ncbi:hypothetical protein BFJ63_vAg16695 [Fusarium oxysporum f. sp. narcissi]|uniref:RNase H type-1 domain-containing protein n=1 Tax=Fusarium oxysporum f. sp. narcissi TaxID=451672 RepID=A0A4Q2V647_FUSOX|nr:hypothetical protein BFJ63_vAg16695 [Fusarium oxysporum f. sp. narcissi]